MTHNTETARLREVLEKYADELCEGWCKENGGYFDDCSGCPARQALQPQPSEANAELVEVLKPFADFAARIPESSPDAMCIWPSWSRDDKPIATVLDFRRAAAALRTGQQTTGHICPTCGALPKDKCTSAQGNVLPYPHAARQQGVE